MEYLRNAWNNVTYTVIDWWYYFFGARGSQQLLLEYIIMDEDLSSRCVYTGDDAVIKSKKKSNVKSNDDLNETYEKLKKNHDITNLSNDSRYIFLFEKNDC